MDYRIQKKKPGRSRCPSVLQHMCVRLARHSSDSVSNLSSVIISYRLCPRAIISVHIICSLTSSHTSAAIFTSQRMHMRDAPGFAANDIFG